MHLKQNKKGRQDAASVYDRLRAERSDTAGAGHVVFHGPREEVLPFFTRLGFALPERKGIADFLQEVTSAKDQQVRAILLLLIYQGL